MTTTTDLTPAQQWNAAQAARLVPDMLASTDAVKRNSKWIARIVLAVTTPHQVLFLGSLGHGGSAFEVITAWVFAALIPLATDLGMLTMLRITQTEVIEQAAKRRALIVLIGLVLESAVVNFMAPGHMIFRVLVGLAAVVLAAVEWVHASVKPDPVKLAAAEAKAAVVLAPVVDQQAEQARLDRNARERARRQERKAQQQAAAAAAAQAAADKVERRRLARQVKAAELASLEHSFAAESAPVSGDPATDEWRGQYM
jgi:signal transduction histidine kinase